VETSGWVSATNGRFSVWPEPGCVFVGVVDDVGGATMVEVTGEPPALTGRLSSPFEHAASSTTAPTSTAAAPATVRRVVLGHLMVLTEPPFSPL
jgi:hypothetical protein